MKWERRLVSVSILAAVMNDCTRLLKALTITVKLWVKTAHKMYPPHLAYRPLWKLITKEDVTMWPGGWPVFITASNLMFPFLLFNVFGGAWFLGLYRTVKIKKWLCFLTMAIKNKLHTEPDHSSLWTPEIQMQDRDALKFKCTDRQNSEG